MTTTTSVLPKGIPVGLDELDLIEWRVTEEARPYMVEAAERVRTLGHDLLRQDLLVDDDVTTEDDMEVTTALALSAHLRVNRLPEAIYAHRVLLALAGRVMQDHGEVILGPWQEIIGALAEYIGTVLVFEDGEWVYRPDAVLV